MRLDKFLSERYASRTKAAEAIEQGYVLVNGKKAKPSDEIDGTEEIVVSKRKEEFVSNGGYKLAKALRDFSASVQGKVFADIGASTGGFTDCLLQNGARRVYALDVGESLLSPALSGDPRIVVMDRVNARYLESSDFPEPIDGVTADVSFISLRLVLPVIASVLKDGGEAYALIKPQFECNGKKDIGKSGIVRDRSVHKKIIASIYDASLECGLAPVAITNAPLKERKNIEYVIRLQKGGMCANKESIFKITENLT